MLYQPTPWSDVTPNILRNWFPAGPFVASMDEIIAWHIMATELMESCEPTGFCAF